MESLVVFVVSTTGTGQEPRSFMPLYSMLMRADLPSDMFDGTSFAVFGLGDSSYEKFCWAAKKVCRRMRSLGAKEVLQRGEGDEQAPTGCVVLMPCCASGLLIAYLSLESTGPWTNGCRSCLKHWSLTALELALSMLHQLRLSLLHGSLL